MHTLYDKRFPGLEWRPDRMHEGKVWVMVGPDGVVWRVGWWAKGEFVKGRRVAGLRIVDSAPPHLADELTRRWRVYYGLEGAGKAPRSKEAEQRRKRAWMLAKRAEAVKKRVERRRALRKEHLAEVDSFLREK